MSYIEDIRKITPLGWITIFMLFTYSIAAGVVFIVAYGYSIFISMSVFKLIVLSLSITLPVISFNIIIYDWSIKINPGIYKQEEKIYALIQISFVLVISSLAYFMPVIWKIIFPNKSLISGCRSVLLFEACYIAIMYMLRHQIKKAICGEKTDSKKT